jgi:hypothetical protein
MALLAGSRRCKARVGPSRSHALEGRLLAVRHCAVDGEPPVSVWAQRDRMAAQWAKGTGEAIEAVYDLDNGRDLAGLRQRSTIRLRSCPVLGAQRVRNAAWPWSNRERVTQRRHVRCRHVNLAVISLANRPAFVMLLRQATRLALVRTATFLIWATAERPPVVLVRRSNVSSPSSPTGVSA